MPMRGRNVFILLLLGLCLQPLAGWKKPAPPGRILIAPDPAARLADRFAWAARQATPPAFAKGYWVGYSIQRLMGERSFIGSWHGWSGRLDDAEPTIESLIAVAKNGPPPKRSDDEILREAARKALEAADRANKSEEPERRIKKDVGLFFKFTPGSKRGSPSVELSNLDLSFDFEGLPLLWLGAAPNAESFSHLEALFRAASEPVRKEDFLSAITTHQEPRIIVPFLDGLLKSNRPPAIKERAIDGLGDQDDAAAVTVLRRILRSDPSSSLRESAVSALTDMSCPEALDLLIETARQTADGELRKEAARGLAEQAAERIERSAARAVFDAKETEVQRLAVESLAELPSVEALPALARIAETHANPDVRRAAAEALGELDDRAAVAILIRLIKK